MEISRRQFVTQAAGAATLSSFSQTVGAQTYPERPVRMIVPFAPGGPADALARLIAEKLSKAWSAVLCREPGWCGGNLGMGAGARASLDGYTITIVGPSFVVNPSLYPKIPYDPHKDFAPVTLAAVSPNVLVIHPSISAQTVKELISFLKDNPGKYSFAHPGKGTTAQLSGEMFRRSRELDIVPVSFNGSAPAIHSPLGRHTPIAFTVATPAVPQVKEGLLRALAVTSAKRLPVVPDVPTLAEAGLPNQEADSLMGVLVPARTPEAIISLLNREIVTTINQPDTTEKLAGLGFEAVASSPTEFAARIETDMSKWAQVIRTANIKAE